MDLDMKAEQGKAELLAVKTSLVILLPLLMVCSFCWGTLLSLIARWTRFDESYGHGFLLLMVVVWLFYELRQEIAPASNRLDSRALLFLLPALLLWFIGRLTGIILFEQVSLPALWWGGIWFLGGWPLARSVLFPVGILYFAIPIWDHLNSALVALSVVVETLLLELSGLPVLVDGNRFSIPYGVITIADGCSGLRYVIIGMAFGTLSARLYFSSWQKRGLILLLSLLLSLLANWIRIFLLVLIGYFTKMHSSLMHDHEFFGFWVFGIMLIPLFLLIRYRSEVVEVCQYQADQVVQWRMLLPGITVLLVLFGSGTFSFYLLSETLRQTAFPQTGTLSGTPVHQDILPAPVIDPGTSLLQYKTWQFESSASPLYVQAFWYAQPGIGDDFLPYRTLLNRERWMIDAERRGEGFVQLTLRFAPNDSLWLMRYWIEVGGIRATDQYVAKLAEIPALFSGRKDGLVVTMFAPCPWQGCEMLDEPMDKLLLMENEQFAHLIEQ